MEGGNLQCIGNDATTISTKKAESYGIYALNITVTGGKITASSGKVTGDTNTSISAAVHSESIPDAKAVDTGTGGTLAFIDSTYRIGGNPAKKVTLTEDRNIEKEKDRICTALTELGKTYDGCFATLDIRKAKKTVENFPYDESKTYEENVDALEAILAGTTEKVVKRHDFIYGCPFMTVFAGFVEWVLDVIVTR